jgi:hypothetical protein
MQRRQPRASSAWRKPHRPTTRISAGASRRAGLGTRRPSRNTRPQRGPLRRSRLLRLLNRARRTRPPRNRNARRLSRHAALRCRNAANRPPCSALRLRPCSARSRRRIRRKPRPRARNNRKPRLRPHSRPDGARRHLPRRNGVSRRTRPPRKSAADLPTVLPPGSRSRKSPPRRCSRSAGRRRRPANSRRADRPCAAPIRR